MDAVFSYIFSLLVLVCMVVNPCYALNLKLLNDSKILKNDQWQIAAATWYGPPDGAGSDGGACGYGDTVEKPPFSKMISAGGPSLFLGGKGCGACYEVKCTENAACSGTPVNVVITDNCPGCIESFHFDLSGTAFGAMAHQGQENNLRNAGLLNVQFRRISCNFGKSIAFFVDNGANPYYFATEIEYENGDGDLVEVELKQNEPNSWIPMYRSWGSRWALNAGYKLQAPFSIKLTEASNGNKITIVADNVIPLNWSPGQAYRSFVNFPPS